jgi:VIT1/CCC1 family predicted Fe2+/Mn2+ transporter
MKMHPDYFRNLIFGAEDSFVSTVGFLFGIASSNAYTPDLIIKSGLVLVAVEALSMGAGSYLSEESTHQIDEEKQTDNPILGGTIMFFSYFLTGFIPLSPFLFFNPSTAKYLSLLVTLIGLFLVGYFPQKSYKHGIKMSLVAGAAALIGYLIGVLVG